MICNFACLLPGSFFGWDWWNRWNSTGFGAAMWDRRAEPVEPALSGLKLPKCKSYCVVPCTGSTPRRLQQTSGVALAQQSPLVSPGRAFHCVRRNVSCQNSP